MVLEISHQYAKNVHFLGQTQAAIPGGTVIGPVIEVHVAQLLGKYGHEFFFLKKINLRAIHNEHHGL